MELAADMLQQSAVSGDGLLDLFFRGFAHKSKTSVLKMKVHKSKIAEAALRCPQREGIITPGYPGKKWDN